MSAAADEPHMADKMLHAAQSFADLTGFEGTAPPNGPGGTAEVVLGRSMYKKLRAFDSKFLQPMFGSNREDGGREESAAHGSSEGDADKSGD